MVSFYCKWKKFESTFLIWNVMWILFYEIQMLSELFLTEIYIYSHTRYLIPK